VRELAPECRADLRDLLDRGGAVEPREQRVVQRRGNGERRQRPGQIPVHDPKRAFVGAHGSRNARLLRTHLSAAA
jgi:hypothetical protein